MNEIAYQGLLILTAVVLFGAILGIHSILQRRRSAAVPGVVRNLEGTAAKTYDRSESIEKTLGEKAELAPAPALYGIPYLAWILTSLLIPITFGICFLENLIQPYSLPAEGARTFYAFRAPAQFEFLGVSYERHQVLIPEGQTVSSEDRQLIAAALMNRSRVSGRLVAGTLLLLAIFFIFLLYHMNILYPTSTEKNRNLVLIYLIVGIVLAAAKVALFYDLYSPYLIPVPWAGMAITIFINRRIVPLTMLITVIAVSIVSTFDLTLFMVLLAGGLVSGTWVRRARKRSEVIAAAMMLGGVMVVVLVASLLMQGLPVEQYSTEMLATFSNGALAGLLLLITLPLFEMAFDVTTSFRLMELLDMNTPLLKELFFKAPGTYQHSMAVANFSEVVAAEIGANDLLVRVGAYYHDIGKMFNPEYFIENQSSGKNPHDDLGPVASAAVVRSHVILGVKLGREVGLPGAVVDFIAEHHGTSTIDYFFHKSRQLESEIKSEKVFKYPGPKPRTRETAIVMIVDSVEAASRVLQSPDEDSIRSLIDKIARRKLEQGELDYSGLTIGELKKMTDILARLVKSSGHARIAYPPAEPVVQRPARRTARTE